MPVGVGRPQDLDRDHGAHHPVAGPPDDRVAALAEAVEQDETGTAGAVALLTGTVLMATGLRRRVDISPWGDRASAGLWIYGRF